MLTFTGRRNMFGFLANNTATNTLTNADALMNDSEKRIIAAKDWPFLQTSYTVNTVASQQAYQVPPYMHQPQNIYITVGGYRYTPDQVSNLQQWNELNEVVRSSSIPTHWFYYAGQVNIFPTPSASSNVITMLGRKVATDLVTADYSTGTVDIINTSGVTTTITGAGGAAWSRAMIGSRIRVNPSATSTACGDNLWYEIATVPTATTLTLTKTYGGTALTTGAAASYTIGQVSLIPEPHDQIPIFEALKIYFTSVNPDAARAKLYGQMGADLYAQMVRDFGSRVNVVLDDGGRDREINPNLIVSY